MPWCIVTEYSTEKYARDAARVGDRVIFLPPEILAVGPNGQPLSRAGTCEPCHNAQKTNQAGPHVCDGDAAHGCDCCYPQGPSDPLPPGNCCYCEKPLAAGQGGLVATGPHPRSGDRTCGQKPCPEATP